MKVILVDKHEIFLEGLSKLLTERGLQVVAKCRSGTEALQRVRNTEPDVVITDIEIPASECIETTRSILEIMNRTEVLVLTHSEEDEALFAAMKMGAKGYVSKDIEVDDLIQAIEIVAGGGVIITAPVAKKTLAELSISIKNDSKGSVLAEYKLSGREYEVLSLVAQGDTNKDIACNLYISENTVKVHLRNIMEKLHVKSRWQAALLVNGRGISNHTSESYY